MGPRSRPPPSSLMQHFRHNLNSVAAAQQQKLELLVGALGQRHWESAMAYAQMAQTTAEQLVAAYTASRVYVKVIDTSRQLVSAIIGAALQDASWTSRQSVLEVKLESTCPTDLYCSTDLAIAVMVLGTLLENAHDELTHSANSPQVIRVVAGQLGTDDDHQVYIDVSDSGGGVPEQWRDKLFKPGETTKTGQHKGQGIALVLAKGRMTDIGMDGDLEFMGNDGPGARFRIWLPQAKQA